MMTDDCDYDLLIGARVRAARERKKLTQDELAAKLDFKDRQTVSTIEAGTRSVAAAELVRIAEILQQPLDFFTDPHRLIEEQPFSFRAKASALGIAEFSRKARKLVELNRRLAAWLDEKRPLAMGSVRMISSSSTTEHGQMLGHGVQRQWNLGEVPARNLQAAIEAKLSCTVLLLDMPNEVSGAACHLGDGDLIFINRSHPAVRRNWTLAHELFHLLTWEVFPPAEFDPEERSGPKPKAEQLADAFAGSLLMPIDKVRAFWSNLSRGEYRDRLASCAQHFEVSSEAMQIRLRTLGQIQPSKVLKAEELPRSVSGVATGTTEILDRRFGDRLSRAMMDGHLSVRFACEALELEPEELSNWFQSIGVADPVFG